MNVFVITLYFFIRTPHMQMPVSERTNLFHVLDTLGLVQRIDYPTYQNGHLLDYVITRRDSDFASNFSSADKISDHMALHALIQREMECMSVLYVE